MLRLLCAVFTTLMLAPTAHAANWHTVSAQITLIEPQAKARFILPNMALIQGKACSALIDSHGDFVALEQVINQLKERLNTPLCHLIATTSEAHQLTGLALLKQAFPNASVHLPKAPQLTDHTLRKALDTQLSNFAKSIELSEQRVSKLPAEQQGSWRQRLALAKQRLTRWQTLQSTAVTNEAILPSQLELGGVTLKLSQFHGQSGYDLSVLSVQQGALFAGQSANLLPYVRNTSWHSALHALQQTPQLDWILPAFGKPYKAEQLSVPITFLTLAQQQAAQADTRFPAALTPLYQGLPYNQMQLTQHFSQAVKVLAHKKALNK
ncbi:hypothetical protein CWB99_02065 [Pseudoalteromonas rubra]|uniref:Metallo-beta-lactamase domain-containing protein n=1 Tax=Pseudoalteromonas rubra TaxID=43658 RepID=A0A5S3WTI3_9GAMM|nr:hypothetical protein [Pseudoalteromonas rubra]TMP32386.1 hypothetical protein CWB99_02065 [Pseudoalteromonas rubra]TMP36381.1 hypothetical protein CWC00_01885 [Pseudoalteromonas rubra]